MKLYFSDFFEVSSEAIEKYGAFNISLLSDLPLFIDPFLLFNSKKAEYRRLHDEIIKYLRFLKDKAASRQLDPALIHAWYRFPEIKQNWLGFSFSGNRGSGLGLKFAHALYSNLGILFEDFGYEQITRGSHLEKLCLIASGVGKDNISDFTMNLTHGYLLDYTQQFAQKYLEKKFLKRIAVDKVAFNYQTETWERGIFELPFFQGDYVLLTPRNILTKDDTWINSTLPVSMFDFSLDLQLLDPQLHLVCEN